VHTLLSESQGHGTMMLAELTSPLSSAFIEALLIEWAAPWRQFVPWDAHPESGFLVSAMMEKIYGTKIATVFTAMVLWTAFGSVFALLLGYSRIPYAAALDGYFFKVFGRLHPTKRFPYVALIVLGVIFDLLQFVFAGYRY
jgi:fructoselysine transporter